MAAFFSPSRFIGGSSLGNLYVRLTADPTKLISGMNAAKGSVATSSAAMTTAATVAGAAVAASLAVIGVVSVREFAKFNKAMTESTAIMGTLDDRMRKALESTARGISREGVKSATELAESYFFLASAGLSAEQSLKAIPVVTNFATAGAFDMSKATDLLTDAQSALGLTVKDANQNMENMIELSDILVKANTLANASVEQFSTSITHKAGAAMKAFNVDVEEGVAVLAALADQGVKSQLAGTALSNVLRDLQRAAIGQPEIFRQLGIQVFDASGEIRNMADIIADMEVAFADASTEQKRMSFELLGFQDRSLAAILALLGTSEKIRGYEKELRNAAGITEEVANNQLQAFSNQLKISGHRLQDVAISIGEGLAPALLELNDTFKENEETLLLVGDSLKAVAELFGKVLVFEVKRAIETFENLNTILDKTESILTRVAQFSIQGKLLVKAKDTVLGKLIGADEKTKDLLSNVLGDVVADTAKGLTESFKNVETQIEATTRASKEMGDTMVNEATKAGNAVSRMIDSAKTNELLNLLGTPKTTRDITSVSAQKLMENLTLKETGNVSDMLRAAGLMGGGSGGAAFVGFGGLDAGTGLSEQIDKEVQMNKEKLKILEDLGNMELELTKEVQERKAAAIEAYNDRLAQLQAAQAQILLQSGQRMFDELTVVAEGFAGQQSSLYKSMFAASKAFAIAESIVKIQQGVASAASLPFPSNLVAMAGVVAATANIISTIQSIRLEFGGERAEGGPVSANKAFLVGERGPEMFVPGRGGSIVPNDDLMGRGTKVIINNYTDARSSVSERDENGERIIEVVIQRVKNELGSEIRDGRGDVTKALQNSFGLKRGRAQ